MNSVSKLIVIVAGCSLTLAQELDSVQPVTDLQDLGGAPGPRAVMIYDNTAGTLFRSTANPPRALDDLSFNPGPGGGLANAVNGINIGFVVLSQQAFDIEFVLYDNLNPAGTPVNTGPYPPTYRIPIPPLAPGAYQTGMVNLPNPIMVDDDALAIDVLFFRPGTNTLATNIVTHLFAGGGPLIGSSTDVYWRDANANNQYEPSDARTFGGPPNLANFFLQIMGDPVSGGGCNPCTPCQICGPGPHFIHLPGCPPGEEHVSSGALVGIDTNFDCLVDMNLVLRGPFVVRTRSPSDDSSNFPGTRPIDGHRDVIDTEIISMSLTGAGVVLTAGAGQGAIPLAPTLGNIAELPTDPSLADSFFDVFFEVDLGGGNRLYNQQPLEVGTTVTCLPPDDIYFHPIGICIPLYTHPTPGQGVHMANLVSANHDPFPRPGACCFQGQCTHMTHAECTANGGVFHGEGSECLGDGNGNGIDDRCESQVPPADDCWHTTCGQTQYDFQETPLPCDFFDPGSEPFDGTVLLGGGDPGGTDTIVRRHAPMYFGPNLPTIATTPIELVQLSLVSCEPITVTYCTGAPDELWDLRVSLSNFGPPPPAGSMMVTKTHPNGGVFSSNFFVQPVFTFVRRSDGATRTLDTGLEGIPPMMLDSTDRAPWVHQATINVGPQICGINFVPGIQEEHVPPGGGTNCVSTRQCQKPVGHASGRGHLHVTGHIAEPCPCGACCLPDGSCVEISSRDPAADCASMGGQFKGIGSSCTSADGDAIPDVYETGNCCPTSDPCPGRTPCRSPTSPDRGDTDGDGVPDHADPEPCNRCLPLNAPNRPAICDQFDVTLPGDGDCDDDGLCDLCEIELGLAQDCNQNGVPDGCERDCQPNGLPDDYDIACGSSQDNNGNGIPDECEPGRCCPIDTNCDGSANTFDIQAFVDMLGPNPPSGCSPCSGDANGDGSVNAFDIQNFVDCLSGLGCPPGCP